NKRDTKPHRAAALQDLAESRACNPSRQSRGHEFDSFHLFLRLRLCLREWIVWDFEPAVWFFLRWIGFGTVCFSFVPAVDSFRRKQGSIRVRTDVFGFWHLDC